MFNKELGSKLVYLTELQDLLGQPKEILVQESRLSKTNWGDCRPGRDDEDRGRDYERSLFDDLSKAEQKISGLGQDIIKAEQAHQPAEPDGAGGRRGAAARHAHDRRCVWRRPRRSWSSSRPRAGWRSRRWFPTATSASSKWARTPRSRWMRSISRAMGCCRARSCPSRRTPSRATSRRTSRPTSHRAPRQAAASRRVRS